jgi:hypothetical protein
MKMYLPNYSIKSVKNTDLMCNNRRNNINLLLLPIALRPFQFGLGFHNNINNNCNNVEFTTPMTAFGPIILKFVTNSNILYHSC